MLVCIIISGYYECLAFLRYTNTCLIYSLVTGACLLRYLWFHFTSTRAGCIKFCPYNASIQSCVSIKINIIVLAWFSFFLADHRNTSQKFPVVALANRKEGVWQYIDYWTRNNSSLRHTRPTTISARWQIFCFKLFVNLLKRTNKKRCCQVSERNSVLQECQQQKPRFVSSGGVIPKFQRF